MARPTKYDEKYNSIVESVCELFGADDKQISKTLGITEKTLNNWKKEYPELLQSLKKGKDLFDTKNVEIALRDRALGYSHKEDKIFQDKGTPVIVPTIKHYPPDPTACIFWLKNRQPHRWRDVKAIEMSGVIEQNIKVESKRKELEKLSYEELLGTINESLSVN